MTRFCRIRGFAVAKNPFVFNGPLFGFANFRKFFLCGNVGNQRLIAQKIWIHRFWDFTGCIAVMAPWIGGHRKNQDSTIPYFPKQFVAVLSPSRACKQARPSQPIVQHSLAESSRDLSDSISSSGHASAN
ncbi:MAG: hypothetical protein ABSE69_03670 [Roseiarcus sp.]